MDRTIALRSGGESLVATDGRRAASRRVVVSCDVLILELENDDGIALPVGRTNALQLVMVADATSTADKSLWKTMSEC